MTSAQPPAIVSLIDLLAQSARAGGDRTAVIDVRPTGIEIVSYESLLRLAAGGAACLAAMGVQRGDVVGVWLANSKEAVAMEFAAASLGAIVVGMNTRYRIDEVAHVLTHTGPRCVVLPLELLDLDFRGMLSAALSQAAGMAQTVPPPAVLLAGGGREEARAHDLGGGAMALELDVGEAEVPGVGGAPDLVNMFSTSGSTGLPKFATHDQESVVRHALNVANHLDIRSGDVLLCALPLCGVFGFNAAMAGIAAGASCLLVPTFDGAAALRLMADWGVTHTCGGDDLYARLVDAHARHPVELSHWRRGGIADFTGRAIDVVAWAETQFGARLSGVYGSSECFAFTAIRDVRSDVAERTRGGGDLVDDAIEVRALDVESGEVLGPGETGELQLRGYNVMRGYFSDPSNTAQAVTDDGWLRTGDLGAVAQGGRRFSYQCRAGDALRLHGFLVEPAEIESFLMRHPSIDGACVVAVRGDEGADEVVAFVTVHAPVEEADLITSCRQSLAGYKVPKRIVMVQEFPVTTGTNGGKVRLGELRERALALVRK